MVKALFSYSEKAVKCLILKQYIVVQCETRAQGIKMEENWYF